ncbi:MAG: aminotransferase class IV, partial [Planctomycetia bacterium]|nr:aminotransferase class IV [Planctomycetia bacterium]
MSTIVYIDGRFTTASEAKVSLLDRAYLFGDSVFDTLRTYQGVPFRLGQHLDRLMHSARVLGIPLHQNCAELAELTQETVRRSGLDEAYVRITLSRGEGGRGLSPVGCDQPVLSIIARPLSPYPAEAYRDGIRSMTVNTRRVPAACLDPSIKCGNYLPSIMARRELDVVGMIEGVQLGVNGTVVCGTVSNLFIVRDGELRTPDVASGCLPGVTRAAILELAAEIGLKCIETTLRPADLAAADEMFFCNTLM